MLNSFTTQSPGPQEPLRRIVDSTVMIGFARLFMPVMLAVIGWFMVMTVTDLKKEISGGNEAIWLALKETSRNVQAQAIDIATLKERSTMTAQAISKLSTVVDKINAKQP